MNHRVLAGNGPSSERSIGVTPRFSVVIPTFNRAQRLRSALESVSTQKFPPDQFEVIVVDDGSSDETSALLAEVRKRWPLRSFRHDRNRGQSAACNLGTREARGELVAFTDDDCLHPADWLARMDRLFRRYPWCSGVGGLQLPMRVATVGGRFWEARIDIWSKVGREANEVTLAHFVAPGTNNVAYRRAALLEVGGFCEQLFYGNDADLNWRLLEAGHRLVLDPALQVRHHDPETLAELWKRFIQDGQAIFPFLARRGNQRALLRSAARRTVPLAALVGLGLGGWQPAAWVAAAAYMCVLLYLRRRWVGRAERAGEKAAFGALALAHDLAAGIGFWRGAIRYAAQRGTP